MALPSLTTLEVRSTGNDGNGGGFVSGATGTDFSQQNSAQYTFSDLASSNGTNASPQVTSASHSFVAADVGNLMQITAGTNWTTGFYEIVSVSAGAATMDRAVGSAASLSGGSYAVGGALATPSKAFGITTSVATGANPGLIIWIKTSTYTVTSAMAIGSSTTQSISAIGYDVTRGDNTGNRPLLTTATNSIDLVQVSITSAQFDNINFSSTAGTPGVGIACPSGANPNLQMRRCKLTGFSRGVNAQQSGSYNIINNYSFTGCEIANCTSDGIFVHMFGSVAVIMGCYIHNNGATGGTLDGTNQGRENVTIIDSIFDSNGSNGVSSNSFIQSIRCYNSVFSNNSGDGVNTNVSNNPPIECHNCVFYNNTGFGINNNGANAPADIFISNCAFGSNGGGTFTGLSPTTGLVLGQITLTSNPFTSSTNFAPNSTAGGGALLKNAGFPVTFGSGTTSNLSVGPVEMAAAVAGGLVRATMSGGMFG